MAFSLIGVLIFSLQISNTVYCYVNNNIEIINVERLIDVSTQIVTVSDSLVLTNVGESNVDEFLFIIEPEFVDRVTSVQAAQKQEKLRTRKSDVEYYHAWSIKLKHLLPPNAFVNVEVQYEMTEILVPYPTHILQGEKQLVQFTTNGYFYSVYNVINSTVVVETNTKSIEDYTKLKSTHLTGTRVRYGPYNHLPPYSKSFITVHYLNNSPFLVVTKLRRSIEISHWGNIAIEDDVMLENKGAILKGSFSRFEYQRDPISGFVVHTFKTILPKPAVDIYYRDEIGNISTSLLYYEENTVEVELRPRFPLFGGWRTRYTLGYNLPASYYLFRNGNQYLLKMPLIDLLYRNMVIEEATVSIILPEGCSDIDLITPFDAVRLNDRLHFTYLDIIGRPTISFKKYNLIDNDHLLNFELWYTFSKIHMLTEPIILIISFFLLFLLVIGSVRLDFSLYEDEHKERKLRIAGLCNQILAFYYSNTNICQKIEEKLLSFIHNKDSGRLNANLKKLNNDYKSNANEISGLATKLRIESPQFADKAVELLKEHKQLKDLLSQQQTLYTDKLVPGKVSKSIFAEQEDNISRKKEEILKKIQKLIKLFE